MAKRKDGAISTIEQMEIREKAIKTAKEMRVELTGKIPYRVNPTTIIFLDPGIDRQEQIDRFLSRLESDRRNYY